MQRYEKYKDSGVKWIGEIPEHWEVKSLRFFLKFVSEKNHPDKQLLSVTREKGVIVRDTSSKEENHNFIPDDLSGYKYVREGQFVINKMKAWQGSYGVSEHEGIVSPAYYVCDLDFPCPEFFSRAIRSKAYVPFFTQYSKGIRVDQWDLSPIALKSIPFVLPPLPEQQAIVSFLDAKTEKIDLYIAQKEKEIERLQELKQVEIANAVTHGLNPNAKMKPSGIAWIGDIPEEWEVVRLAMLFKENKTKNTDLEYSHALKFYFGTLVPKGEKGDVSDLEETYNAYTKIKIDDIAINGLNLNYDFISQRVAIAREDGIITSAYLIMTPREGVYSEYFLYLFKAMDSMKLFHGMGTGIRLTLSYSELKKQSLPLPPLHEQRAIVERIERKLERIDRLAEALRREIGELKELKKRIISDAVTGRIKIA